MFYAPPVEGVIVDPFRPPAHPGAPGNRGLEYATRPGSTVRAAAAGIVTFAGRVGSGRHVTLAHADGVRTSYSFLAGMAVRTGQSVGAGDVLGTAGASFHFGARIGEAYVDPAVLLGIGGPARLVPLARRGATGWFGDGRPIVARDRPEGCARRRAGRLPGGPRACPIRRFPVRALPRSPQRCKARTVTQPMGRRPWHPL